MPIRPPAPHRATPALTCAVLPMTLACAVTAALGAQSRCEFRRGPTERVVLADGSAVTVNASGAASNGWATAFVGTPTHVWRNGAGSAIGVIRDSGGTFTAIPSPLDQGVLHPRIAAAHDGGWHVVFVTGREGTTRNAFAFDSADVWYGRFDGRDWRDIRRVAHVSGASLSASTSSELRAWGSQLAFAFPFEVAGDSRGAVSDQGIVLLRGGGGPWQADTLRTWRAPHSVQLADGGDSLVATYAQPRLDARGVHPASLFRAAYLGGWGEPRLLRTAEPRFVSGPLTAGAGSPVIAWRETTDDPSRADLVVGRVVQDGPAVVIGRVDALPSIDRPAFAGRSRLPVLVVRDGDSRQRLRVLVVQRDSLADAGAFDVPVHSFVLVAPTLPDGRFLVLSGALGATGSDAPATSLLTAIAVRCPAP